MLSSGKNPTGGWWVPGGVGAGEVPFHVESAGSEARPVFGWEQWLLPVLAPRGLSALELGLL